MGRLSTATLFFLLALSSVQGIGIDGGTKCAGCVVIVALVEQLSFIYNETVADSLARFCSYLPPEIDIACQFVIKTYGPSIIDLLEDNETPDTVCYGIEFCKKYDKSKKMCHLFPLPPSHFKDETERVTRLVTKAKGKSSSPFPKEICSISAFKKLCQLFNNFTDYHTPLFDEDGDSFSIENTFRGADWRGKDCNDLNPKIYPGRLTSSDAVVDSNCNGIVGIDPASNKSYEELWCNGTMAMGTILLGDSAGAHFHIPPSWLTAKELNTDTYSDLLTILENELDWPMLSFVTGFQTTEKWKKDIQGPVDSTYLKMRTLNRCNHRDYQNIGVNGARSSSMKELVKFLARHRLLDKPVMATIELLGNDVCSGHEDTSHMTTPEEYYNNMHYVFEYLDSALPVGSVVFATGLVDGRILYDTLHSNIHPIGSTRGDVTYSDFYDYLNCLEISPCFGWMNSNETWRNLTSDRALELTQTMEKLIKETKYQNITVLYMPVPLHQVFDTWKGDKADLIEPVDGFHPSQITNALVANVTWQYIRDTYPDIVPPENPYNELIQKKFGDQGGY
ncbi:PREDICTED: acyloxyacyl hydrolase-like [Amphimedon queenslandica]|uniref:Saposin B-type domain-containing protein n=1 Tax=Amphimedon queenslandica TaxID=400682 RepID=A0A1X7VAG5_AMPQE|nr:PREDICTED: acyloxyacyl hydrolase-like [Amphimedon queenslandica]|eukprot:XP_003385221.1 PREDICTED: acyloxyacyl hydrolase-like [Amphimedon queenslandica]